jgi:hypothetical protein
MPIWPRKKRKRKRKQKKMFKIGDWVVVKDTVFFEVVKEPIEGFTVAHAIYGPSFLPHYITRIDLKRVLRKTSFTKTFEPFVGQIVGFKYCYTGEIIRPKADYSLGIVPPNYLEINKTIGIWLVRRGLMNRECMTLDVDIELCIDQNHKLPLKWVGQK